MVEKQRRLAAARKHLILAFRIGVNAQTRLHCLNEFHAAYVAAHGEPLRLSRVFWTNGHVTKPSVTDSSQ
jgi:hypothetical protein